MERGHGDWEANDASDNGHAPPAGGGDAFEVGAGLILLRVVHQCGEEDGAAQQEHGEHAQLAQRIPQSCAEYLNWVSESI
jgi:hypothetical protein